MRDLHESDADHDGVQRQVDADDPDGEADRFLEALEEHRAQPDQQQERERDRVVDPRGNERVADDVRGGVGGRQRDRDDEVRRGEAEQAQDEGLAFPARQQLLEHRDAAPAVRAGFRDPVVDRQRAEQGEEDDEERGERREEIGREEGDARLIPERGKIVDPREAHDLPPRRLVPRRILLRCRAVLRRARPGTGASPACSVQTPSHPT